MAYCFAVWLSNLHISNDCPVNLSIRSLYKRKFAIEPFFRRRHAFGRKTVLLPSMRGKFCDRTLSGAPFKSPREQNAVPLLGMRYRVALSEGQGGARKNPPGARSIYLLRVRRTFRRTATLIQPPEDSLQGETVRLLQVQETIRVQVVPDRSFANSFRRWKTVRLFSVRKMF